MRRYFLKTMQGRITGILIVFLAISLSISLYSITYVSQKAINAEKETKLVQIAEYLGVQLGDGSYNDILAEYQASEADREEKIDILNKVLAERTESLAVMFPGLGVGYYSLELDAILTYGPASEYGGNVGISISGDHPGRTVMAENTTLVRIGSMVRGDIMNAMVPLVREGKVIGYAWANELTSAIQKDYRSFSLQMMVLSLVFFVVAVVASFVISRRVMRSMDALISGVKVMRNDLTKRLPPIKGDLQEVTESINNMADHLEKNTKEHEALMLAEAANAAQRDFLARMSHEIRTPMNGVLGMTKLAMQAETPEKSKEYLKKIQSSATLLLGIINDILDFSKIEANMLRLDYDPFDLRQSIRSLLELIEPRIQEKQLTLHVTIDESLPAMVVGDEVKLSQILLNLLGNASKFTEKGSIGLSVKWEPAEGKRYKLVCTISDTGIGMDDNQIENLFQPFTQADSSTVRKYGGTGLGLSISKAFIKLMGGAVSVRSKLNEGSTFEFCVLLDAYQGGGTAESVVQDIPQLYPNGLKTLLAEDNEINQEIAVAILSELGLVCDVAENGKIAVSMYREKTYDLIFMDIRMPIMDGLEATRCIRQLEAENHTRPPIPIIAMTANAMREDRELSLEAGMNAHVSKPVDIEEIQQALYQVFQKGNNRDEAVKS